MKNSFKALTDRGGSCLSEEGKKVSQFSESLRHLSRKNTRLFLHGS